MRKFIFLLSIIFCAFAGWLSASYFRGFLINDSGYAASEKLSESVSDEIKSQKIIPLPPADPDFVKSERQLISEILLTNDTSSLGQIFLIKDENLRKAFFEKYLEDISVDDFPDVMDALEAKGINLLLEDNEFVRAIEVWLKRDFETAKDFVLEKATAISENNIGERQWGSEGNHEVKRLLSVLCERWMKSDKDGCLLFVQENASLIPGISETALVFLGKEDPERAYNLLKEMDGFLRSDGHLVSGESLYAAIFKEWVKKEPNIALEKILTLENDAFRKQSLAGIIDSIANENPSLGLSLIREHLQGENYGYYIHGMYQRLSEENKEKAIDLIRQGDFSEEEKNLALRGVATSMSAQELYDFLHKESLKLSEEERNAFIRQAFLGPIPFREGNSISSFGSQFDRDTSEESMAAKVALFELLSEEQKIAFFSEKSGMHITYGREDFYLSAYKTIPPEKRDERTEKVLLYNAMYSSPKSAIDYYLSEMNNRGGGEKANERGISAHMSDKGTVIILNDDIFNGMVQHFYLTNPEETMAWIASIEDENLKNRAKEGALVANAKNNVDDIIEYLKIPENASGSENLLKQLSHVLVNNQDQLLKVVTEVQSDLLPADFWKSTMSNLASVSEDEAFGFIDDLAEKPVLQHKAVVAFAENLEYKSPDRALTLLLELPQSSERENLMKRILKGYADNNPEGAEAWKKKNNYE